MTSFSGFIIASPEPRDFHARDFELKRPAFPKGATLYQDESRAFGLNRWDRYTLNSTQPLADEPEEKPTYPYPVLIVRGFSKLLVLGHRRRIVDQTMSQVFSRSIFPNLRKVPILIDKMIEHCRQPSAEFLITSVHGKYSGSDDDLRSISLYGDDVSKSAIFSQHYGEFNFHTCGLGRRMYEGLPRTTPAEDGEILRIANDGFVSLKVVSQSQALEVQSAIDYVMSHRWVEEWVPEGKGSLND